MEAEHLKIEQKHEPSQVFFANIEKSPICRKRIGCFSEVLMVLSLKIALHPMKNWK
jgi:hypothetical protein